MKSQFREVLDEIVRRIVEIAQPEKVILFGSAARDQTKMANDIDLLVVKKGAQRRRLACEIYKNLIGVGCAVDIVVVTPEDVERYKKSSCLVIEPALREGVVLYAA